MRRQIGLAASVVLGLVLGAACSDREKVEEEPDRVKLCSGHCSQIFGPCNPDPPSNFPDGPQTEDECNDNCVDDLAWEGKCRFKYADSMTCTAELSCEEFMVHQSDALANPCLEVEGEWSSCVGGEQ